MKQLLDEWTSLPQETKEEAMSLIASRFVHRVPAEHLAVIAEQFATAGETAAGSNSNHRGSSTLGSAGVEAPAAKEEAEATAEPEDYGDAGDSVEADGGSAESHAEAMRQMLESAGSQPAAEWCETWSSLVLSKEDQRGALTALFEAALGGEGNIDLAPSIVTELARSKTVEIKNVELALQAVSARLEKFVEANENAWHIHSHALLMLFPKTLSTTWGFERPGWTWTSWWLFVEKVLQNADHFRAFDVLVMVLQMVQEKSGAVIKKLQVWKEGGRTAKVRKVLCGWAEMDDASIVETLAAYGVEL